MFRKIILVGLIALAVNSFGANNSTGWLDTVGITARCTTGVVANTKCFQLSEYEDIRLLVKVNDTSSAAYSTDSVSFIVGYQTGVEVLNGSNLRDTLFGSKIILDTVSASEFGTVAEGLSASDGSITLARGGFDTLSVTGFATGTYWFVPEWDGLIRFWVKGLAANNKGSALKLFLEPKRRIGVSVK
jgi:hypothetical protein